MSFIWPQPTPLTEPHTGDTSEEKSPFVTSLAPSLLAGQERVWRNVSFSTLTWRGLGTRGVQCCSSDGFLGGRCLHSSDEGYWELQTRADLQQPCLPLETGGIRAAQKGKKKESNAALFALPGSDCGRTKCSSPGDGQRHDRRQARAGLAQRRK